ncbi:mucin-3A [Osmerus mordax]|uniref:mucin-3A n=1 Tax=Osmerus mordax TaxID=8014 RepID=UPI003510907B
MSPENIKSVPTRKLNISLRIDIEFHPAYSDLHSTESFSFINALIKELMVLCMKADPQNFKNVEVINLRRGSVIADTEVQYNYPNNDSLIHFLNTGLKSTLLNILNNTNNLNNISQAFGNVSVEVRNIALQPTEIMNITDLRPYITCHEKFANYTPEVSDGSWKCHGPCLRNRNYCNGHGQCLNNIQTGPICRCYESGVEQYTGPQCEMFHWGPGFYGAVFGSLSAALLLVVVVIVVIVLRTRHQGIWNWEQSPRARRLSALDEDFFDFSNPDSASSNLPGRSREYNIKNNLGFVGDSTPGVFRPHLEHVDTSLNMRTKRPEIGS